MGLTAPEVYPINFVHPGSQRPVLQAPVLDHRGCAPVPLLCGLEDELHGAVHVGSVPGIVHDLGSGEQTGHVPIVSTGVHDTIILRLIRNISSFC